MLRRPIARDIAETTHPTLLTFHAPFGSPPAHPTASGVHARPRRPKSVPRSLARAVANTSAEVFQLPAERMLPVGEARAAAMDLSGFCCSRVGGTLTDL